MSRDVAFGSCCPLLARCCRWLFMCSGRLAGIVPLSRCPVVPVLSLVVPVFGPLGRYYAVVPLSCCPVAPFSLCCPSLSLCVARLAVIALWFRCPVLPVLPFSGPFLPLPTLFAPFLPSSPSLCSSSLSCSHPPSLSSPTSSAHPSV